MADCFLSYSRPDTAIAERIAAILEQEGISVWYWTRDIIHSVPHPDQTFSQIDQAGCFICVVSATTLETDFVFPEILRVSSKHKPCVVVLNGLTYAELERARPRWCQAFGFAPALQWEAEEERTLVTKLLRAVRAAPAIGAGGQADRQAAAGFQLGRLVFLLMLLESGEDTGQVSALDVAEVRQKVLGYYSFVFGSDCDGQAARAGISLATSCERNLVQLGRPAVEVAYWIGSLMQVYLLAHGDANITAHASGLRALARDRARMLGSLPDNSRVQEAAAVLLDHAARGAVPTDEELARASRALQEYYEY